MQNITDARMSSIAPSHPYPSALMSTGLLPSSTFQRSTSKLMDSISTTFNPTRTLRNTVSTTHSDSIRNLMSQAVNATVSSTLTTASNLLPKDLTLSTLYDSSLFPTMPTTFNTSYNSTTVALSTNVSLTYEAPYSVYEIILLVVFILIFCVGTVGNALIFYFFCFKKTKQSIPATLFSYLALVDFFASVVNPLVFFNFTLSRYQWQFSEGLCKFTLPLGVILTTMSGAIFIIIAIDRERTIVFPFKSHFKLRTIKCCVAFAAIYAFFINFHYALKLRKVNNICSVPDITDISYWLPTLIVFVIQDLTLIFVFTFTNVRIVKHIRSKGASAFLGALWEKRKRDNAKIIRLLIALATVFFVLTIPRDMLQLVHCMSYVANRPITTSPELLLVNSFVKVLHTTNSCVNVFIYYYMHKGFRRYIRKRICCLFKAITENSETYTISTITTDGSPTLTQRKASNLDQRHINTSVGRKRTKISIDTETTNNNNNNTSLPMAQTPQLDNSPDNITADDGEVREETSLMTPNKRISRRRGARKR